MTERGISRSRWRSEDSDCYWWKEAATDDGTHIVPDNGLRLPKAEAFDGQGWPENGRYDYSLSGYYVQSCINANGEVIEYRAR